MKTNFKVTSWSFKIKTWKWIWNSFIKMWCNVLTRPNLRLQWSSSPSIAAFYNASLQTLRILHGGHRGELLTNILVTRSSPPSTSEMGCPQMQLFWKIWIWIKRRNGMNVSAYLNRDHLHVIFFIRKCKMGWGSAVLSFLTFEHFCMFLIFYQFSLIVLMFLISLPIWTKLS